MIPICKREAFAPPPRQPRGRRGGKERDRFPPASSPVWGDAASAEGRLPMSPAARQHPPGIFGPRGPSEFPVFFAGVGDVVPPGGGQCRKTVGLQSGHSGKSLADRGCGQTVMGEDGRSAGRAVVSAPWRGGRSVVSAVPAALSTRLARRKALSAKGRPFEGRGLTGPLR